MSIDIPIMTTGEYNVMVVNRVGAVFSMCGSLFIIVFYWKFKDLRSFAFHLVCMMAISDFFQGFGNLLGDPTDHHLCQFQAVVVSFFDLASLLWQGSISFTLYMAFIKEDERFSSRNINLQRKKYHLVCWLIPGVLTLLPAFTGSYGNDFGQCWIPPIDHTANFWRVAQFYFPLWIVVFFNTFVFAKVYRKMKSMPSTEGLINRLFMYPAVLLVTWSFDTVYSFVELFSDGESVAWLAFLGAMFAAFGGFFNSLVYGWTKEIRERLCYGDSGNGMDAQEPIASYQQGFVDRTDEENRIMDSGEYADI